MVSYVPEVRPCPVCAGKMVYKIQWDDFGHVHVSGCVVAVLEVRVEALCLAIKEMRVELSGDTVGDTIPVRLPVRYR